MSNFVGYALKAGKSKTGQKVISKVKDFFTGGGKNPNPGQAIKSVKTNVPETKLEKLKAGNVIGGGRLKGAQSKLKQTMFEMENPQFSKGRFTFKRNKEKSESNKEAYKRIQGENTKVLKGMIDDAFKEKKAKGGRIGYKLGSPRKTKLKKIQEAFKTTPSFMNVKKNKPKKRIMAKKGSPDPKKKKGFPDLSGDGKTTFKDILIGRGVIKGKKKPKKKII